MKSWFLPTADSPALEWLGFVAFLLLLFLCLAGFIVWLRMARGGQSRRRQRKHRHHRPTNPTLAQTGGLPPKRDPNLPPPGP
jgi:uncharacterized iron-regulated membrane protein